MKSVEEYIDKLRTIREEVTDKAMGDDVDSDLEDLIKLDNVDDELYEMLLILFTRSKNKLATFKNENAKNTLMLIDMQIVTLEHILHTRHHNRNIHHMIPSEQSNPDIDINIVNNATPSNNTNTNNENSYNWAMVFNANNIFKIGLVIIFMLLVVWSMFIINPKAANDTANSIVSVTQEVKGKEK